MNQPIPEFGATARVPTEVIERTMQSNSALAIVKDYVVDSPEAAQTVNRDLQRFKAEADWLDEERKKISKPLYDAWTNFNGFFNRLIEPRRAAQEHCTQLLLGWRKKQEEEQEAAKRRADEEARKRRQEEEARAAAERAKADEAARQKEAEARAAAEARKKAEAAAEAAAEAKRKAIEDGNKQAAKEAAERERKAREEAQSKAAAEAKAREQAVAVVESAENNISNRQAAAPTPASIPAPAPTKLAGFSKRTYWKGRLKGLTDKAREASFLELVTAAVTDPQARALLMLDQRALDRTADGLREKLAIPGVEAWEDVRGSSRTA